MGAALFLFWSGAGAGGFNFVECLSRGERSTNDDFTFGTPHLAFGHPLPLGEESLDKVEPGV